MKCALSAEKKSKGAPRHLLVGDVMKWSEASADDTDVKEMDAVLRWLQWRHCRYCHMATQYSGEV